MPHHVTLLQFFHIVSYVSCLCFFLHAALQYITELHLLHVFVISLPSLPQLAHVLNISVLLLVSAVLILRNILFISHTPSLFDFDAPSLQILLDELILINIILDMELQ